MAGEKEVGGTSAPKMFMDIATATGQRKTKDAKGRWKASANCKDSKRVRVASKIESGSRGLHVTLCGDENHDRALHSPSGQPGQRCGSTSTVHLSSVHNDHQPLFLAPSLFSSFDCFLTLFSPCIDNVWQRASTPPGFPARPLCPTRSDVPAVSSSSTRSS